MSRSARPWRFYIGALAVAIATSSLCAEEPGGAAPSAPSASLAPGDPVLGPRFESTSAGISFCPPAVCRLTNLTNPKYVAEWADADSKWRLSIARIIPSEPRPLTSGRNNFGVQVTGLLEETVDRLKNGIPGCEILRQDLTNTAEGGSVDPHHPNVQKPNVGLIAVRYSQMTLHLLSQQALIQANDRLYYLLTLTTPATVKNDDAAPEDAGERTAVETFNAMLDTVRLLDGDAIRRDQNDRLYRTRTFLLNLTPSRLHSALIKQQWLRYIRNGKDIGYSYITEETAADIPRPLRREEIAAGKSELDIIKPGDGVLIGIRSRTIGVGVRSDKSKGAIQTDSANWLFVAADRKHEEWSRLIVVDDHVAVQKEFMQEIGLSDKRTVAKAVKLPPPDQGGLGNFQPNAPSWIDMRDDYGLDVNLRTARESPPPISRKLPPWYIPQAVAHLLPRLVGANPSKQYLFATYVPDVREVMMRYVDVLPEQNVTFAGQSVRAIPVQDRFGIDGSITLHYMSPEGAYLGSENKDQKLLVLPSDAVTLSNIWRNANLTKPEGVQPQPRLQPGSQIPGSKVEANPALVNPIGPPAPREP